MKKLAQKIRSLDNILLTTHRNCDGDGLGAQMAVYFALKKSGKRVHVINIDPTPKKYRFLEPDRHIQYFENDSRLPSKPELLLVFDTNDQRLIEPLYHAATSAGAAAIFLDHHPILEQGPKPSADSIIDVNAASTGEMAYRLIKELGIEMDRDIARCLYTSITFDTQLYRFIRNSPVSHQIAAELLTYDIDPEEIHRGLFGNQTVQKMAFLAKALGEIEYFGEGRVAILKLKDSELLQFNLEPDESRDLIDMIMSIETLEAAAIFREESDNNFRVSLRSKGHMPVLKLAESIGGGGHMFAAGASYKGSYADLKKTVVDYLTAALTKPRLTGT